MGPVCYTLLFSTKAYLSHSDRECMSTFHLSYINGYNRRRRFHEERITVRFRLMAEEIEIAVVIYR